MNLLNESCYEKEKYMRVATEIAKQLYFYAQWAGRFVCKQDFRIKRSHLHSFLLIYTMKGSGVLDYKGKQHLLEANSLCFLDCQKLQTYSAAESPWAFKFIHFYGNLGEAYYNYIVQLYDGPVFPCAVPDMEYMFDCVIRSVQNIESEALCSEYIYRILTSLIAFFHHKNDSFNFKSIMNYIATHYAEPIDVGYIAQTFNFSRSYFTTKFTAATGISPYAYLRQCRITAAKELLLNTSYSVQIISERCGFSSSSSFIRTFKSVTGTTPQLYKSKA